MLVDRLTRIKVSRLRWESADGPTPFRPGIKEKAYRNAGGWCACLEECAQQFRRSHETWISSRADNAGTRSGSWRDLCVRFPVLYARMARVVMWQTEQPMELPQLPTAFVAHSPTWFRSFERNVCSELCKASNRPCRAQCANWLSRSI